MMGSFGGSVGGGGGGSSVATIRNDRAGAGVIHAWSMFSTAELKAAIQRAKGAPIEEPVAVPATELADVPIDDE